MPQVVSVGYFPPLVMGATYDADDNDYTVGLVLAGR